jgi:hypothetical protein
LVKLKQLDFIAALVVFSDFSIAWFTSVIAIHTFGSLVLRQRTPVGITTLVVVCGWLFAGLMGVYSGYLASQSRQAKLK